MQILGLADSTPQPESRAKVLFWPAVRNETDVDHVTRQGFWICFVIAFVTLCVGFLLGTAAFFLYAFQAVFFFLSGIGIRMRSVFAASAAFIIYYCRFRSGWVLNFSCDWLHSATSKPAKHVVVLALAVHPNRTAAGSVE
jgi:hypothetical protein